MEFGAVQLEAKGKVVHVYVYGHVNVDETAISLLDSYGNFQALRRGDRSRSEGRKAIA